MGIQQIPLSSGGATLAEITANLPSLAQINTSVANNSSGFNASWTSLAFSTSLASSTTYSSLGNYKFLRLIFINNGFVGGQDALLIRFNGDASSNYNNYFYGVSAASNQTWGGISNTSIMPMLNNNNGNSICVDIEGSNSTMAKVIKVQGMVSNNFGIFGVATWQNTAPITSMTVFTNGNAASNCSFGLVGAI